MGILEVFDPTGLIPRVAPTKPTQTLPLYGGLRNPNIIALPTNKKCKKDDLTTPLPNFLRLAKSSPR